MKLPDANVLVYSTNSDSRHHESSRSWLDAALSGADTVAFSWIALLAFLRLATKEGLFPKPLSHVEALDQIEEWLAAPPAVVIEPTVDHPRIVRQLLDGLGVAGDLIMDAHLAALSIEHKCVVVSYDNDFDRFEGVRREAPSS